jgi:hypothetical protein
VLLLTLPAGKPVFRDYVDATAESPGFGERTQTPPRALMRMDGEKTAALLLRISPEFSAYSRHYKERKAPRFSFRSGVEETAVCH